MTRVIFLLAALTFIGCGASDDGTNTASNNSGTPANADPQPDRIDPPDEAPISFNSVEEAIEGLKTAAGDQKVLAAAISWLSSHGDVAIVPLVAEMNNESGDLQTRVYACAALGSIGAAAEKELIAALDSSTPQIRYRASKGLGQIKPSTRPIILKLVELMKHEDVNTRKEAVLALEKIGTAAELIATEPLIAMLNNEQENETVRDAAKRALKSVNPRRTFQD